MTPTTNSQQSANVISMICNMKFLFDNFGYSRSCPKVGFITL
jgi:hypothetical protein